MEIRNYNDLITLANQQGKSPAEVAIEYGRMEFLTNFDAWPEPMADDVDDDVYPDIDLLGARSDILTDYVRNISASIQFPVNTAYLHALGVVSSAMNRSFRYNYYGGEAPVNLYCVTSQPPSSGKSGIHKALTMPHRLAYAEINKKHTKIRNESLEQIAELEAQLEKSTTNTERDTLNSDINILRDRVESVPHYRYAVDDATPEALEAVAFSQNGLFNISSDEADAINVILGSVYSDSKANHGMILKGWDGDWHSPARITRKTKEGPVYGSIAVIAQDEAIDAILYAGASGRGISERILIMKERTVLGYRDHMTYTPIDHELRNEYDRTIYNMINDEGTVLTLSGDAMQYLRGYRNNIERHLADGGKYSNTMLRGVIGKADKQIIKIGCIIHGMNHWCDGGSRSKIVSDDTIILASQIYNELSKTYISAADSQGYMGENAELAAIKEVLCRRAEKGVKRLSITQLRDGIKNLKAFKGTSKLSAKIKDEYLPALQEHGFCVWHGNYVYLNPKLK